MHREIKIIQKKILNISTKYKSAGNHQLIKCVKFRFFKNKLSQNRKHQK